MPLPIRFRLVAHKDTGLRNAREILIRNMRGGLEALGKRLRTSARSRMREDTERSKNSLKIEVKGLGLGLRLEVFSTLVQAFVDAFGMRAGRFPPYRKGSRIYKWAERKSKGYLSADVIRVKAKQAISHLSRRPAKVKSRLKRVKNVSSGRNRVSSTRTARERSIEKQAFLVARHIYERGIRATHWNQKALDANKKAIVRELSNALSRAAHEISRG